MPTQKNPALWTIAEAATILKVTGRQIRNWIKDKGLPAEKIPGVQKLDAAKVIAWYVDFRIAENGNLGNRRRSGAADSPAEPEECYEDALARKTRAEADLKELQLARERGEVAAIADVERVLIGANKSIQTRILAMPSALAPQLIGLDDRQRINLILERYCHDVLSNLASIDAVRDARGAPTEDDEE